MILSLKFLSSVISCSNFFRWVISLAIPTAPTTSPFSKIGLIFIERKRGMPLWQIILISKIRALPFNVKLKLFLASTRSSGATRSKKLRPIQSSRVNPASVLKRRLMKIKSPLRFRVNIKSFAFSIRS